MGVPRRVDVLLRVGKAKKQHLDLWRHGVLMVESTGHQIDDLARLAAADRWQFANRRKREADRLLVANPPFYRAAVCSYYYAMYHAMRAIAFVHHRGDDHQEHRVLPSKTPQDFPNAALWENALKDARERRNAADYDPYPKSDDPWRPAAEELRENTRDFLQLTKQYLIANGITRL